MLLVSHSVFLLDKGGTWRDHMNPLDPANLFALQENHMSPWRRQQEMENIFAELESYGDYDARWESLDCFLLGSSQVGVESLSFVRSTGFCTSKCAHRWPMTIS